MQSNGKVTASIGGGVYREVCNAYLNWNHVYGSGLRSLLLFQAFNDYEHLNFYSSCHETRLSIPYKYKDEKITFCLQDGVDVIFNYEHPFRMSNIIPRPDYLFAHKKEISIVDRNVLIFGMVDADFTVEADKVVFDPQTIVMPTHFSKRSYAKQLVYILNFQEAQVLSSEKKLINIRDFFFDIEKCFAVIIKMGTQGAVLYRSKVDEGIHIPVYKTEHVFTIGSGDVFTSTFAHDWFKGLDIVTSACNASKVVACYSNNGGNINQLLDDLSSFNFSAFVPKTEIGQIYLAGPFFTFEQKWIINEFFGALKDCGAKVFSPLHCVGVGKPVEVVEPDIKGLKNSKVMLAILESSDIGTIFEVGYAIAIGKKVVAYIENIDSDDLTMLIGTGCDIEKDFTTAVYKACWYAYE